MFQTSLYNTLILWIVLQLPSTNYSFSNSQFQMPFRIPRYFAPNEKTNCIPSNESSLSKWPKTSLDLCKSKVCKKMKSLSAPWNLTYGWSRRIAPLILIFGARRRSMVNLTHRPLNRRGRVRVPIAQKHEWGAELVWTCRRTQKSLAPAPKVHNFATVEILTAGLLWRF
jgi:hypothetical protein